MKSRQTRQTPTMNKSAAIYVRVSGEYDERTASLDSQEEACRKLAEDNGYTVSHVLVERHTGRHLHQRKELTKLRELVNRGEIQCIAFYEIDRFTRGGSGHIWMLIHECRQAGVKLLCLSQDLSDTTENNIMISMKAEMAKRELDLIKDRTMRGRRDKLKRGLLPGQGNELYGYRKNKETWKRDIVESEAEIVRRIYREASE